MSELRKPLELIPEDAPKPGTVWKHYKGETYKIAAIGRHSETLEVMVIYFREDEPLSITTPRNVWCRPLSMWHDTAIVRVGAAIPRFRRIR